MLRKLNKKNAMSQLLVYCFLIVYIARNILHINPDICNVIMLISGISAFIWVLFKTKRKENVIVLITILTYISLGIISSLSNQNLEIQEYFWPIAFTGITLILLNFNLNIVFFKRFYILLCLFFIGNIILGKSVNQVILGVSRNNVSVIILLVLGIYYVLCYEQDFNIEIFPSILALIITVWAIGRGGIISISIITISILFFRFKNKAIKIRNPLIVTFIICISLVLINNYLYDTLIKTMIENFNKFGLESSRTIIWSQYIEEIFRSSKNFFLGAPLKNNSLFAFYNFNLHNSFLNLHAKYGLIIMMSMILLIINSFFYFIRKRDIFYILLIVVLLFRSMTDLTSFSGPFDILWYYIILRPFYNYNKVKKGEII